MPAARASVHTSSFFGPVTKKSNLEEQVVEMDLLTTWREIHRLLLAALLLDRQDI
jgi:hypothetical protein